MKSLMSVWRVLAQDWASRCSTSATRDIQTVARRVECEGDGFFEITLPDFSKAFDCALDSGSLAPADFPKFGFFRGRPRFLAGFLEQIFDTGGVLLNEPNIDCIRAVRQLTMVFGKVDRQCTRARIDRAMRQFIETEEEIRKVADSNAFERYIPYFNKAATLLWADVFADVEREILDVSPHQLETRLARPWEDLIPKVDVGRPRRRVDPIMELLEAPKGCLSISHWEAWLKRPSHVSVESEIVNPTSGDVLVPSHGPGATADRLVGNGKFGLAEWTLRMESVFPYGDYVLPSWRSYYQLDRVEFLEPGRERAVKLTPVPKTRRTPRIIAIEPTGLQYMQQAVSKRVVKRIEKHSKPNPSNGRLECDLGRFLVGFEEQEPNRLLACEGSLNGSLATLDLSEASDRVLNQHVELLFSRFPRLSEAIQATRSTKADVPGLGEIPLAKFASMGSALCFPVEAMMFATIIVAAISYERRTLPTFSSILELRGKVRVYGDDIIVPVEYVGPVIAALEAFGLKINQRKSFWNGKFRESCGGDYYEGEWVTPVRLRRPLPQSLADVEGVVGLVAFRNLLYWGGMWDTVRQLDSWIVTLSKDNFPIVPATSAVLGRESVLSTKTISSTLPNRKVKLHAKMHHPLVKGMVLRAKPPKSTTSGEGYLLKFLHKRQVLPFEDGHLERQGRPKHVSIKLRWKRVG
nr:MAG: hypothetical protein 3 [Leviviridae sp.]